MKAYINDRFVNADEAVLHISDLSMQRGFAVFDFFRTINTVPLFIDDHLQRFYGCAKAMHLEVSKQPTEIKKIVKDLVDSSGLAEAGIRVMLTGGYSADSYQPATPNLVITCVPVKTASTSDFERGYRIITYPHQRELPQIKSINYQMAVWLQPLLKEKKADDVLYCNGDIITEFPRSNVFIVTKEGGLVTPASNVLAGITRKKIMEISVVAERDITLQELYDASEVFLTSTTKKIIPVIEVDGKKIGQGRPGPVTSQLLDQLLSLQTAATAVSLAGTKS